MAHMLCKRGIRASIYYLTQPNLHYDIWRTTVPAQTADMGFKVGLHTDHYYEELIGGRRALEGIRSDLRRLCQLIGQPVHGMVWHGRGKFTGMFALHSF